MASFSTYFALLMAAGLLFGLYSPANAETCSSQTFTARNYTNCVDLPYLKSYLHWTYNQSNSSLSVAFIAPPAELDGWVAWAINPNGTGMIGSQAFIAFRLNGTYIVGTYNINSYQVLPSKLSIEYWDMSVEEFNGNYTIFATVRVPATAKFVNHVWQTGPKVNQSNGWITQHSTTTDHLSSKGVLNLTTSHSPVWGDPSPSPSPSNSHPPVWGEPSPSPSVWGEPSPSPAVWGDPSPSPSPSNSHPPVWGEPSPSPAVWGDPSPSPSPSILAPSHDNGGGRIRVGFSSAYLLLAALLLVF